MLRVLLFLSIVFSSASFAGSVGIAQDVVHEKKSTMLFVESEGYDRWSAGMIFFSPTSKLNQSEDNLPGVIPFYGVKHIWHPTSWFETGLGLVYIGRKTAVTGTRFNFELYAGTKLGKETCFCFKHFSHGTSIGIERDKNNAGFNFIGLSMEF